MSVVQAPVEDWAGQTLLLGEPHRELVWAAAHPVYMLKKALAQFPVGPVRVPIAAAHDHRAMGSIAVWYYRGSSADLSMLLSSTITHTNAQSYLDRPSTSLQAEERADNAATVKKTRHNTDIFVPV